ncbi:hypothetical protein LOK49_LG02G03853 [Camellia lanceoleosa]|uniref:Uncharacterized protein n=1 Tax=Camellia lanceoleosa TaxID=1840588 RepID=A0ACC0IPF9_9ERIC|nr:hypothetical protein LOK49_LG02G03853 [Camellia lanceoleosa]
MRKSSRSNGGEVEWGNSDQLDQILKRHPGGFDMVLGADIYILIFIFHPSGFNSSTFGRKEIANSYWLMFPEPKLLMQWLSVKLMKTCHLVHGLLVLK